MTKHTDTFETVWGLWTKEGAAKPNFSKAAEDLGDDNRRLTRFFDKQELPPSEHDIVILRKLRDAGSKINAIDLAVYRRDKFESAA